MSCASSGHTTNLKQSILELSISMVKIYLSSRNTKGGSINVPLTSCFTVFDWSVLQIKTKIVVCHTADCKPVKQEVNGTVILPPLVFPAQFDKRSYSSSFCRFTNGTNEQECYITIGRKGLPRTNTLAYWNHA